MSRYCLDTSAYSHFKRGAEAAVHLLDSADWIGMPVVVLGELRTGFALGRRASENQRELAAFMRNPAVELLEVTDAVAQIYSEIVVGLRKAGRPLPTNDIWIAAIAAAAGATVVTYDEHFRSIQRVGALVLESA